MEKVEKMEKVDVSNKEILTILAFIHSLTRRDEIRWKLQSFLSGQVESFEEFDLLYDGLLDFDEELLIKLPDEKMIMLFQFAGQILKTWDKEENEFFVFLCQSQNVDPLKLAFVAFYAENVLKVKPWE